LNNDLTFKQVSTVNITANKQLTPLLSHPHEANYARQKRNGVWVHSVIKMLLYGKQSLLSINVW